MTRLTLISRREFQRIWNAPIERNERLALIADMCRANALTAIKRAGSGHIGTSFSAMDIVTWLYYQEMNTLSSGFDSPNRDIYFSSKGHDAPGLYSVLFSAGVLSQQQFLNLRRLDGLDGHPDVRIPGIEANSGSLGMGISKGRGMAWAKRRQGHQGRVFVLTGDGELQEGQIYEALQTTVQQKVHNLTVIVDHNKVQSDKPVEEITALGDLETRIRAFGWHVERCNGHDFAALDRAFRNLEAVTDRPRLLVADTIKGCGVSFMAHPYALQANGGIYRWHSGAPDDDAFATAYREILDRINNRLEPLGLAPVVREDVTSGSALARKPSGATIVQAYGQTLVKLANDRKDLIVLDGDLAADCGVRAFETELPDRFIENGIAEQDMVSMAGGLARQGLLPVVNSFASFLATRPNEQIYNNATENTRIIYACHFAGLLPAGPGKSHQSIRDIALFGSLPNCTILHPCNPEETRQAVNYCVNTATEACALRLFLGSQPGDIPLPNGYTLTQGRGVTLTQGDDAVLFAYGPVMLHEALCAAEMLAKRSFGLKVVNLPWLNRTDSAWLAETIRSSRALYVVEDHAPAGGLGDHLLNTLVASDLLLGRRFAKFAVEGYPACGTAAEVLKFHRLDAASLVERILSKSNAEVG